jgi:hypothetical protein
MSFDVFLQRFSGGDSAAANARLILETLDAYVVGPISQGDASIATEDGGADVYGLGSAEGIMVNHTAGEQIWEALVKVADEAELAIVPVGRPTCVTQPLLLEELPTALRHDARVVTSGKELAARHSGLSRVLLDLDQGGSRVS